MMIYHIFKNKILDNMKILHIDDNETIIEPIQMYLELDFDFTPCTDPVRGLELIKSGNYDIVLLDLAMPVLSGYEIVEALSESGEIKNQKIIIFSASNSKDQEIENLKKKGIHSYLQKTISMDELIDHIKNAANEGIISV